MRCAKSCLLLRELVFLHVYTSIMKTAFKNIWVTVRYLFVHCLFWLVTFALLRLLFVAINSGKAIDAPLTDLAMALVHGLVFDFSIVGYLTLLYCVVLAITCTWAPQKKVLKAVSVISGIVSSLIVFFSPADAVMYSYWGYHYDATCIAGSTMDAVETWALVIYIIAGVALVIGNIMFLRFMTHAAMDSDVQPSETKIGKIFNVVFLLVLGALMIIPIRGGTGIAPLSNSRAYFCECQFANHVAMSPSWNFLYSTKRLKEASTTYHFMDDSVAENRLSELQKESGDFLHVFNTERPNVMFILLESFSAHGIEFLGGINATPTIKSLLPESVAFNNIMAASDRSGKGLVAAMCGYPVLPTISIIQYPKKTQSLPFISKKLRNEGYASQTFIYGGDLNFNNFKSLVNIAGFDKIITEDDFDESMMGDKWGAHDQYTFDRLLEEANGQKEPFFDFYFTLSSHEPFTVPMEKQLDDPYLNSVYYTDKCLGDFIKKAKQTEWWKNTVLILMADHGHPGPDDVGVTDKKRFNIPLILTGGAMAVRDTMLTIKGTQIDVAKTLLRQLDIDCSEFTFSKNLLDKETVGYSFFDFNDGFGYVDDNNYQVYDNRGKSWLRFDSTSVKPDSISGKAILQMMSNDNMKR